MEVFPRHHCDKYRVQSIGLDIDTEYSSSIGYHSINAQKVDRLCPIPNTIQYFSF